MKHVNVLVLVCSLTVHSFASSQVFSKQSLAKLPLTFASVVKSMSDSSDCTVNQITLYSNSNKSIQFFSFRPCSKSPEAQMNNGNYPPLFWLYNNDILPIDLWDYHFMYASGEILQFTDLNNNQMPELWLTGEVCECDGDPEYFGPEGCNCTDTIVVELSPNKLKISSNSKFTDWEKAQNEDVKWVNIVPWNKEKWKQLVSPTPKPVKTTPLKRIDSTIVGNAKVNPSNTLTTKEPDVFIEKEKSSELDDLFGVEARRTNADPLREKVNLYESEIKRRIFQNWNPTVQSKLPVILEFTVNPNGTLGKVILVKSSGNRMLDMIANRALEMAFPMKPIPKDISETPFKRQYRFESKDRYK